MNKELIKKYRKEFNHWLDGDRLLAKHSVSGWIEYYGEDIWTHQTDLQIVIDDEYVEFRKALAEGKTVERLVGGSYDITGVWQDFNICTHKFDMEPKKYHIKPDEPKLKVGDWVRHLQPYDEVFPVTEEFLNNSKARKEHSFDEFELWEPHVDEWCWFWKSGVKGYTIVYPLLGKFKKFVSTETNTYKNGYRYEADIGFYTHCEPFIGELPSNLKDK